MATIKSYTDLEQSKKLAEILPIESADMYYINGAIGKIRIGKWGNTEHDEDDIPCWGLAALLRVLPYPTLYQQGDVAWGLDAWVEQMIPYSVKNEIFEVDACVDMIIKLHELNLL